jgi:hypothetical protein
VQAGIYDVTFPGDIDSWAWLASLGAVDSTDQVASSVTAELGDGTTATKVVCVRTFTGAAAADRSSHLVVQRLASQHRLPIAREWAAVARPGGPGPRPPAV